MPIPSQPCTTRCAACGYRSVFRELLPALGTRDNGMYRGPIPRFWKDERNSSNERNDERTVERVRPVSHSYMVLSGRNVKPDEPASDALDGRALPGKTRNPGHPPPGPPRGAFSPLQSSRPPPPPPPSPPPTPPLRHSRPG